MVQINTINISGRALEYMSNEYQIDINKVANLIDYCSFLYSFLHLHAIPIIKFIISYL